MIYFVGLAVLWLFLLRRSPSSLLHLRFRWPYMIFAGLAGEVILNLTHRSFVHVALLGFLCVLIIWLTMNLHLKGIAVILAGALLNGIAIAANRGSMPVLLSTVRLLHVSTINSVGSRHSFVDFAQGIWWLGDWIPVPPFIMSPGDLVVGLGILLFALANTRKRAK